MLRQMEAVRLEEGEVCEEAGAQPFHILGVNMKSEGSLSPWVMCKPENSQQQGCWLHSQNLSHGDCLSLGPVYRGGTIKDRAGARVCRENPSLYDAGAPSVALDEELGSQRSI